MNNSSFDNKKYTLKWVDLVTYDAMNRTAELRVRCILENGKIRFEGPDNIIDQISQGIGVAGEGIITPEHGEKFLKALGLKYRNPYFFASEIKEGPRITEYTLPEWKKIK